MIPSCCKMVDVKFSLVVVWTLLLATADYTAEANDNASASTEGINVNSSPLTIETAFKPPHPLPSWPRASVLSKKNDFGTGEIDIGGLKLRQVTSLKKIWSTKVGGPDDLGATFYQHSSIPIGFSMLGAYAQPNNKQISGQVLVGKTDAKDESGSILKPPTDYTLLATTPENNAYFWLPIAPNGYVPVGLVVTSTPNKPSLDDIRCVRSDFTEEAETDERIWGDENGLNIYGLRPKSRGAEAQGFSVGTFTVQRDNQSRQSTPIHVSCLRNKNPSGSSKPDLCQIKKVLRTYSPYIYFHPDESYLPSSVDWFFANGALLFKKGDESHPVRINRDGSNLPRGGSNDGAYWMDLPVDGQARENVKGGDKQLSGPVYLHVKPVLGSTHTDIQIWIFYPFNGHARLRIGKLFERISLEPIGEHVSDWEHVTLRINNIDGKLQKVYFAAHAGGEWVDQSALEYRDGKKFVVYASLNGHASYSRAGLVLLGDKDSAWIEKGVGIRDDTAMGSLRMDTGAKFEVVAADWLSEAVEPPWLNYMSEWGPRKTYDFGKVVDKIEKGLFGPVKKTLRKFLQTLPKEFLGQEGPTGPKMKKCWNGDEITV